MVYLVASAQCDDLQRIREATPELWRQVRRYNQPVQLALAAAPIREGGGAIAQGTPFEPGREAGLLGQGQHLLEPRAHVIARLDPHDPLGHERAAVDQHQQAGPAGAASSLPSSRAVSSVQVRSVPRS